MQSEQEHGSDGDRMKSKPAANERLTATNLRSKLSIVIPVYGSERILPELVRQIGLMAEDKHDLFELLEIILVCDQSPDNSWSVIRALSSEYVQVKGILLRMNAGQHNALMAGLAYAKGDIIVTMDDDLQHSPADIPSLVREVQQGSDVVYARFRKRKHALWKVAGSYLNDVVARYLVHKPSQLYLSPFRAMRAPIRDEILRYRGPYVYIDGLILSSTRNISTVYVDHHDRYTGDGGYSFRKSVSLWSKMAINFSLVPLRITSLLGLCFSAVGFVFALLFVIQKLTLDRMPNGWSSLIVAILTVGGVQLLALGMLGEYLGRVLLTINSRPQYVIADIVEHDPCDR
jgi:polyisoprenyl-phosphate glycosyltransferase